MNYYKLRVTRKDEEELDDAYKQSVISWMSSEFSTYYGCFEKAKCPHSHWYIESSLSMPTLRARIQSRFGKGNGLYSFKTCDGQYPIEYIAYMMKDRDTCHQGIPPEVIQRAKDHDVAVKSAMAATKKERKTVLQKIEEEYFSSCTPIPHDLIPGTFFTTTTLNCFTPDAASVVSKVVGYHHREGILIREFQIVSICQTLCLKYVRGYRMSFELSILDRVMKNQSIGMNYR